MLVSFASPKHLPIRSSSQPIRIFECIGVTVAIWFRALHRTMTSNVLKGSASRSFPPGSISDTLHAARESLQSCRAQPNFSSNLRLRNRRPAADIPALKAKSWPGPNTSLKKECSMFRVDDQTELCWVLETAQMIVEADLTDGTTGDAKANRHLCPKRIRREIEISPPSVINRGMWSFSDHFHHLSRCSPSLLPDLSSTSTRTMLSSNSRR